MGYDKRTRDALSSRCILLVHDVCEAYGIRGEDRAGLASIINRCSEATIPHMGERSCGFSVVLSLAWDCLSPGLGGTSFRHGTPSSAYLSFGVFSSADHVTAVGGVSPKPSGRWRKSGAVFLHNEEKRAILYALDADYSLVSPK